MDGEKVSDVLEEMRIFKCRNLATNELENCPTTQAYFAKRIEAAHNREMSELRERLDAVVKECEKQIPSCRGENCKCNPTDGGYCDENCHDEIIVHTAVTAILRVARGDAGKEEE